PVHEPLAARFRDFGLESVLLAPLHLGERALGVLLSGTFAGEPPLTEHHLTVAADIARHASVALANATTRRDVLARNRELRLLNAAAALPRRATAAHQLHDAVVARTRRASRGPGAFLQLGAAAGGVLRSAPGSALTEPPTRVLTTAPPRL